MTKSSHMDFFLEDQVVGYFEESTTLDQPGVYSYMPYRGKGHLDLQVALQLGKHPRCHIGERSFKIKSIPANHSIEISSIYKGTLKPLSIATNEQEKCFMNSPKRLSGSMTENELTVLEEALEDKYGNCPRCTSQLLYNEAGNSYVIFCSNEECHLGFTSRGI